MHLISWDDGASGQMKCKPWKEKESVRGCGRLWSLIVNYAFIIITRILEVKWHLKTWIISMNPIKGMSKMTTFTTCKISPMAFSLIVSALITTEYRKFVVVTNKPEKEHPPVPTSTTCASLNLQKITALSCR